MSTHWWIAVVIGASVLSAVAGYIVCNEFRIWNRARRPGFITDRHRVGA